MNTAEVHTLEHIGATFLRNHPDFKDKVLYFGPMGCRTGFYLLLAGQCQPEDIVGLIRDMFSYISGFEGEVPGARSEGLRQLLLDMNLPMAKYVAKKYLQNVLIDIQDYQVCIIRSKEVVAWTP